MSCGIRRDEDYDALLNALAIFFSFVRCAQPLTTKGLDHERLHGQPYHDLILRKSQFACLLCLRALAWSGCLAWFFLFLVFSLVNSTFFRYSFISQMSDVFCVPFRVDVHQSSVEASWFSSPFQVISVFSCFSF